MADCVTHAAGFSSGMFVAICGVASGPMDTKPEGVTCPECRNVLGLGKPRTPSQLLMEAMRLLDNAQPSSRLRYIEAQASSEWRTRRDALVREIRAALNEDRPRVKEPPQ